jgi:hypothetical protein
VRKYLLLTSPESTLLPGYISQCRPQKTRLSQLKDAVKLRGAIFPAGEHLSVPMDLLWISVSCLPGESSRNRVSIYEEELKIK